MKTSHKIISVVSVTSFLGLIIAGFTVWENLDKVFVTEGDLTETMGAHAQEMKPWTEQTEENTLDRLLRRFKYLETKKCRGGGLTTVEEIEFQNVQKQLEFEWQGCRNDG